MSLLEENNLLVNDGVIAQIMINRPEFLNALNADLFQGLIIAFEKIQLRSDLRVVTLWGEGEESFSAGSDLSALTHLGRRALADYFELGFRALRCVEKCPVPVISAINGYAFGAGLELALASDIIVVSPNAKLGFPDAGLGMVPPFGGVARLIERVGSGAAKKLLYTAELISAEEALRIGLVDKIAEEGQLTETVDGMADEISKKSPLALKVLKRTVNNALAESLRAQLEEISELARSADWEEGISAFLEKREPSFTGR